MTATSPPSQQEVQVALAVLRRSQRTHIEWRDFIATGGTEGIEYAGDLDHHTSRITDYAMVISVLERLSQGSRR